MAPSFALWVRNAEDIAYSLLELKPWELMKLQPMEFKKLVRGYEKRQRAIDTRNAFWVTQLVNTQLKEPITPMDFIKLIYPPTAAERKKAEADFIREFRKAGGEI